MTDPFNDERIVEIGLGDLRKMYALLYGTSKYAVDIANDVADIMNKLNSKFEALNESDRANRAADNGPQDQG